MFDDVFGMVERCAETFRGGVRDVFGASILADVLGPTQNEIGKLRMYHEEYQRQALNIEQIMQEARALVVDEGSRE